MSGLREIAESDLALTLEDPEGFGFEIQITEPGGVFKEAYGQSGDIQFLIDPETGLGVSGRFAHITVRQSSLTALGKGAPVKGWLIKFDDINGNSYNFIVTEARPDRTLGVVTCIVGILEDGS